MRKIIILCVAFLGLATASIIGMEGKDGGKRPYEGNEKEKERESEPAKRRRSGFGQEEEEEEESREQVLSPQERAQMDLYNAMTSSLDQEIKEAYSGISLVEILRGKPVNLEEARRALEAGADPNSWQEGLGIDEEIAEEFPPLFFALAIDNEPLTELLIQFGANVNRSLRDTHISSSNTPLSDRPLERTLREGEYNATEVLLKHGASLPLDHIIYWIMATQTSSLKLALLKLFIKYGLNFQDCHIIKTIISFLDKALEQDLKSIAHDPESSRAKRLQTEDIPSILFITRWVVLHGPCVNEEILSAWRNIFNLLKLSPLLENIILKPERALESLQYLSASRHYNQEDVDEWLAVAAAYGRTEIVRLILERLNPPPQAIAEAFGRAAFNGHNGVLEALRPSIPQDHLLSFINQMLPEVAAQRHTDTIIYLIGLTQELLGTLDIIPANTLISSIMLQQNVTEEARSTYRWIQHFLWTSFLKRMAASPLPSHVGSLPPELHVHIAKFLQHHK